MPVKLEAELVVLCEGEADRQFLRKLTEKRPGFPKIDIPFPTNVLHGSGAFASMLQAIRGDRVGFSRIRGILIIADSTDKPAALFRAVQKQIRTVGGYGVPSKALQVATSSDHPAVAVMLLPDEKTPGALETLLVQEMVDKNPWIDTCVDQFLQCDKIDAYAWPAEKRDKAWFHSMVAALHREDPSRAASHAFRDPTPLIDVEASCFDDVERRMKDFCRAVTGRTVL
jgi:hypothetical protein